ncbi:hypothetical protein QTG54_005738 [Skeletonema marinoi]|uniref:HORMA domain-containing protein n=1 Tax=Skeletonema marinoi TaxID=267567 RepID=A0AAD8YBJ4_9STRA|nr:hypothetical protein QTG54_005738 [Skeletonema marinoi]
MASTNHANAVSSSSQQFTSLLGCTMESIIHELLYSRSIYPPDSYVHHRHLGVRFHCSRVPQVCDYISNFLKVAVPSIVSGVGDSISLVILEEEVANSNQSGTSGGQQQRIGATKTLERFVFQFQIDNIIYGEDTKPKHIALHNDGGNMLPMDIQHEAMKRDTELASEAKTQMERSMRDCLLQVLSLRGRRRSKDEKAENLSFKLCLHVAEEDMKQQQDDNDIVVASVSGKQCPELVTAVNQGEWFQPEESSCLFSTNANGNANGSKGLIRPIRHVNLPSCGIKMQMGFAVPSEQN